VQVAPQPPAFLFPGGDQPGAGFLQVKGEVHGVDGDRCVPGEIINHGSIGGGELPAAGNVDHQITEPAGVVDQRDAHQRFAVTGPGSR
jgi:hypothetical protein